MDRGRSFSPVKVGDELDVKIEAVGEKGDGLAKIGGFVLFVPNTKEGDSVKIRVTRVLRSVGFAEVIGKAEAKQTEPAKASAKKHGARDFEEETPSYEENQDTEDFGEDVKPSQEAQDTEDTEDSGEDLKPSKKPKKKK